MQRLTSSYLSPPSLTPKGTDAALVMVLVINEQYLCHEVCSHADLRWHKFLLHDGPTLLEPRSDGSVSDDVLYVAVSPLHTSNVLTALTYQLTNNTTVYKQQHQSHLRWLSLLVVNNNNNNNNNN